MWSTKKDRERAEKEALQEGKNHSKMRAVPVGVDPRPKWMVKRDGPLKKKLHLKDEDGHEFTVDEDGGITISG